MWRWLKSWFVEEEIPIEELLKRGIDVLVEKGPDSVDLQAFMKKHEQNHELMHHMRVCIQQKRKAGT